VDVDVDFNREIQHYIWMPVGAEILMADQLSFILEIDLYMSEWAWTIYGGGLNWYF